MENKINFNGTILEYLNHDDYDEVFAVICTLSKTERTLLKSIYGEKYDKVADIDILENIKIRTEVYTVLRRVKNQLSSKIVFMTTKSLQERLGFEDNKDLFELISTLPEEEQTILKIAYGEVYNIFGVEIKLSKEQDNFRGEVVKKLSLIVKERRGEKSLKYYNPYANKNTSMQPRNLRSRLSIKFISQAYPYIAKLSTIKQNLLKELFGENYSGVLFEEEPTGVKKELLDLTISELKEKMMNINHEKYIAVKKATPRLKQENSQINKSVLKRAGVETKEELEEKLQSLSEEDRRIFLDVFGSKFNKRMYKKSLSDSTETKINQIFAQLKGSKKKKELVRPKDERIKTLSERIGVPITNRILALIDTYPEIEKRLLKKKYGNDYTSITKHKISHENQLKISSIVVRIKIKINKNISNRIGFRDFAKTLVAISKLTLDEKTILKKVYGNNYDETSNIEYTLSDKEYQLFRESLQKIKELVKEKEYNINEDNLFLRLETKNVQAIKLAISELNADEKEFLKKIYGENYDENRKIKLSKEENILKSRYLVKLKSLLSTTLFKELHVKNLDLVISIINTLNEEDKKLLEELFGKDFSNKTSLHHDLSEKNSLRYKNIIKEIAERLESLKNNKTEPRERKSLIEFVGLEDLESLKTTISKLKDQEKQDLSEYFNDDYSQKDVKLSAKQLSRRNYIISKLKKMIVEPHFKSPNDYRGLLYLLDLENKNELEIYLKELRDKDINILKYRYGESYDFKTPVNPLTNEQRAQLEKAVIKLQIMVLNSRYLKESLKKEIFENNKNRGMIFDSNSIDALLNDYNFLILLGNVSNIGEKILELKKINSEILLSVSDILTLTGYSKEELLLALNKTSSLIKSLATDFNNTVALIEQADSDKTIGQKQN